MRGMALWTLMGFLHAGQAALLHVATQKSGPGYFHAERFYPKNLLRPVSYKILGKNK